MSTYYIYIVVGIFIVAFEFFRKLRRDKRQLAQPEQIVTESQSDGTQTHELTTEQDEKSPNGAEENLQD